MGHRLRVGVLLGGRRRLRVRVPSGLGMLADRRLVRVSVRVPERQLRLAQELLLRERRDLRLRVHDELGLRVELLRPVRQSDRVLRLQRRRHVRLLSANGALAKTLRVPHHR